MDILSSAVASAKYRAEKDAWGQEGWSFVRGVCLWAKERGMRDAPC